MELKALFSDFSTYGYLPYLNLQWIRQYYDYGKFVALIEARYYSPDMAYIYTDERPETGIIQRVAYTKKLNGEFIELSGFFLKKILDDKAVYPTFYANGNIETELHRMVDAYKADIPRLMLGEVAGFGGSLEWQNTGDGIGEICLEKLQAQQLAYECEYNDDDGQIHFKIWQGKDRTQTQTENSFAVFGDEIKNLGDVEIIIDSSNYKNFAFVGGSGEGDDRIVATADMSGGEYQQQVFIDSRNERYDPNQQTENEYRVNLQADGLDTLTNSFSVIENASIRINIPLYAEDTQTLRYRIDYDLGDRCNVVMSSMGLDIEARIIEIGEVIKENRHFTSLIFGETVLTRTQKARL